MCVEIFKSFGTILKILTVRYLDLGSKNYVSKFQKKGFEQSTVQGQKKNYLLRGVYSHTRKSEQFYNPKKNGSKKKKKKRIIAKEDTYVRAKNLKISTYRNTY